MATSISVQFERVTTNGPYVYIVKVNGVGQKGDKQIGGGGTPAQQAGVLWDAIKADLATALGSETLMSGGINLTSS